MHLSLSGVFEITDICVSFLLDAYSDHPNILWCKEHAVRLTRKCVHFDNRLYYSSSCWLLESLIKEQFTEKISANSGLDTNYCIYVFKYIYSICYSLYVLLCIQSTIVMIGICLS